MKKMKSWFKENGWALAILIVMLIFIGIVGVQAVKIISLQESLRVAEIENTRLEWMVDALSELID